MDYRNELNKLDAENENTKEFVINILDKIEDDINDVLGLFEEAMSELRTMCKNLY